MSLGGSGYTSARQRMERARTPMGTVPISTIWGYDYPLMKNNAQDGLSRHEELKDCVDHIVRRSRAFSESRTLDPHYTNQFHKTSVSRNAVEKETSTSVYSRLKEGKTFLTFSTTPWNATGFYHAPRYPETNITSVPSYSKRYPSRIYTPTKYASRRYSRYY